MTPIPAGIVSSSRVEPTTSMPPVTSGLDAYFDAQSLALSDGANVATWPDLSTSAAHATQGTAGSQPTFHTTAVGGYPGVRFQSGRHLTAPVQTGGSTQTVFAVIRPMENDFGRFWCGDNGFGLSTLNDLRMYSLKTNVDILQIAASSSPYAVGTTDLWTTYFNGTAGAGWRKNGVATAIDATSTGPLGSSPTVVIGANFNPGTTTLDPYPFDGYICALLHYDRVLDATESDSVEGYLRTRFGTP